MGLLDRWTKKKQKETLAGHSNDTHVEKEPGKKTGTVKKSSKKISKSEKSVSPTAVKTAKSEIGYKVLVRPIVTEKSANAQSQNKYSFIVARLANKNQIRQAIVEVYGVKPVSINVANISGKQVRFGRTMGRRQDFKKAIITLAAGQSIVIHEGV